MSLVYVGSSAFAQSGPALWSKDGYGLDVCRIPVQGAAHLLTAYQRALKDFSSMAGYPRMWLQSHGDDGHYALPTVTLNFIGTRFNIPPPKVTDGKAIQVAQSSATVGDSDITMAVTYRASRTSYAWYEVTKPGKFPRYATVRNPADPLREISRYVVSGVSIADQPSLDTLTAALFARLNTVQDYTVEDIIPGKLWGCSATVDYSLISTTQ